MDWTVRVHYIPVFMPITVLFGCAYIITGQVELLTRHCSHYIARRSMFVAICAEFYKLRPLEAH